MKKKTKVIEKSDFNCKNGEIFQRMSYLINLSSSFYEENKNLSKVYAHMMKDISKRNAMRINSKYKKMICKCHNLLFKDSNTKTEVLSK
jgi:RNase P subunit RPR2